VIQQGCYLLRSTIVNGRTTAKSQRQQAENRPMPTLDIIRKPGGIGAVTRRSKISKVTIQGNATPSESYRLLG